MKALPLFAISTALVIAAMPFTSSQGQDPDWKPPGTEEAAAVDRANEEIGRVYQKLMSKLEPEQQKSLRDAQRAWIKWRDSEADFITRLGGAVGGSAFRVDYSNALTKLIQQRTEVLKAYLAETDTPHE